MKFYETGAITERRCGKRSNLLRAFICVYIFFYAILSWHGSYIFHNQGGADNRETWFPAYCAERYSSPIGRSKVRLTALGWIFLPPMLIDQLFIHPTRFV